MENDENAVRDMLQRFARAFTTGDGPGAAACWEVPALVVAEDGSRAVSSLAEVAAFFGGAAQQYQDRGITGTRVELRNIDWYTPRLAAVRVRWPYLDAEGREAGGAEESVYLVRVRDGTPRICAATLLGTM